MKRLLVALVLALGLPGAHADEAVWALLKSGGQVIILRHTVTPPGTTEPPGFKLDDCATQRNLTDEGRSHAQRIGEEFRARGIPVARVLASPLCRCVETAKLAFAKSEVWMPLAPVGFLPEHAKDPAKQVDQLKSRAGTPVKGGNLVLVTHSPDIIEVTGLRNVAAGEMVVVTPRGGGKFEIAGRLTVK